jgi:aconitate hydratase
MSTKDPFGARTALASGSGPMVMYRLEQLERAGVGQISRLPYSIKILLEAVLRQYDGFAITEDDVTSLAGWQPQQADRPEVPYKPARVILQDFTGVPSVVDLATLRSAIHRLGGDPRRINPVIPVDLVVDHSVQIDRFGSLFSLAYNAEREFERNRERYEFLRWGQKAFDNFRVVPPATGIVHQVNLEYLARVVQTRTEDGDTVAFPDTVVGTDSHTTMINGLGVVGWGVGGIEAEAAMLGQPMYMLAPEVVGVKIVGDLPEGATATDVVLTVTQMLRAKGVVDKFVEYYGPGISKLGLADRATIANMSPEYGATVGFFPVDAETLRYLRGTGRSADLVDLVERYTKEQGLFRTDDSPDPVFTDTLELDLGTIEPSIAGPKRPQDRVPLREAKRAFWKALPEAYNVQTNPDPATNPAYIRWLTEGGQPDEAFLAPQRRRRDLYRQHRVLVEVRGEETYLSHGSVIIAAITSCTNTSNPSVMIGAGLLAKKAVEAGLRVPPYVKTSLAPGSRVVTRYLRDSGLEPYLQALGFHVVGYGCTTCIGNSGPILDEVAKAVQEHDLVAAAVLSGNRNFEGRIHPLSRANYLASPPLVVAYALAGTVDFDPQTDPIGYTPTGDPVYLHEIWPSLDEIRDTVQRTLKPSLFETEYGNVFEGNTTWNQIAVPEGDLYAWDQHSTYIRELPLFTDFSTETAPIRGFQTGRALALLGDSVTTDHISPAGSIPLEGPAGQYLRLHDVEQADFNSFGARRGNHEVMMRGTFANIRLRNKLLPGSEGGVTVHLPAGAAQAEDGEPMSIYDAAMQYQEEGTPLVVIGGKEYGTGSSRDWAAKGTMLLGVKAVIVESYERIHRSNLVAMGVLPLQFKAGENAETLGLTGYEVFDVEGIDDELQPGQEVTVRARDAAGNEKAFSAIVRINSQVEVRYYRNGGILQTVLRDMLQERNAER